MGTDTYVISMVTSETDGVYIGKQHIRQGWAAACLIALQMVKEQPTAAFDEEVISCSFEDYQRYDIPEPRLDRHVEMSVIISRPDSVD